MAFFPQWLLAFRLFQRTEYGLERSTAAAHFVFRFSLLAFDSTKDIKIDVLSSYVHVLSHKHRGRCVRTNAHTEERHVTYSRISDRPLLFRELPPSATPPTCTHTHTPVIPLPHCRPSSYLHHHAQRHTQNQCILQIFHSWQRGQSFKAAFRHEIQKLGQIFS